ncbi:MAG: hypothetical protein JNM39_14600 [Bdellovibrionaceae bacterium]|nr:hypothetical protein [Pseudobdellovibrionaceae bacterium]
MALLEDLRTHSGRVIGIFFFGVLWVGPTNFSQARVEEGNCGSAEEFKRTFEFLTKEESLILSEAEAIREALLVSAGCDNASLRFQKIYNLLKKSGVDLRQSFLVALKFVSKDDQMVENFTEIFKKIYLENYLDMDFVTALKFSLALSDKYEGNSETLREDFTKIVKFCSNEKEMALNVNTCGQVALELTRYSKYYPDGFFAAFQKVYHFLRTNKRMGIGVAEALRITTRVVSKGPKAPENFIQTIEYALVNSRLRLNPTQALGLGLAVSDLSQKQRVVE